MTAECTNDDKWNCKYCRKVETCEANKNGSTASPPTTAKWCKPCRETGAIHCSDPVNCGGPWDAREARPPTPTGWSDTDWLEHLQERQHPLAGLHINQGSMDASADAYEAEYNARHNAGGEARALKSMSKTTAAYSRRLGRRVGALFGESDAVD